MDAPAAADTVGATASMNPPRLFLLLSLWLCVLCGARGAIELLHPGETLTYRVGWGLIGHAGEMTIASRAESDGEEPRVRIVTTTATRGFIRMLYSFDGDATTLFDPSGGRLLGATARTASSKNTTHASIAFDYERREADYTDHLVPKRSKQVPIPDGDPVDLMTSLVQCRTWELVPGRSHRALVLFDDEFYELEIAVEREETISTPAGPRKAMLLIPRMIGKPRGMFRRGGEIRVWVSADADRLPLRFEVKLKIGTAYAVLTDYRRPGTPPPSGS